MEPGKKMTRQFRAMSNAALRGLGQIMLQEHAGTGIVFLLGISLGSGWMALAACLSAVCGAICARLLGFGAEETERGLYGFSAALVGVSFILFFKPAAMLWLLIIVGSIWATLIQQFFIRRHIPVFTLPFVLVTWLALWLAATFFPEWLLPQSQNTPGDAWAFVFRGFGEVIFQNSILSGILFLVGISLHSIRSAVFGIGAAILAAFIAWALEAPGDAIVAGLFSYNAVLCALALAGKKSSDIFWAVIAVALAVAIQLGMISIQIPVLTFPFVAATMLSLGIRRILALKNGLNRPAN